MVVPTPAVDPSSASKPYHHLLSLVDKAIEKEFGSALTEKEATDLLAKFDAPKDLEERDETVDKEQKIDYNAAFPCFVLAKVPAVMKAKPAELKNVAEYAKIVAQKIGAQIQQILQSEGSDIVERIEAVGPYVNFFYKPQYLAKIVESVLANGSNLENVLHARAPKTERVMIEYSQPNTHKAFHVGHMRNAALGNSLAKLYSYCGYNVVAANYIGDVGAHIAKCLWYYLYRFPNRSATIEEDAAKQPLPKAEWLGELYAKGVDCLDLSRYTRYPFPGFITAQVKTIENHPANDKWKVVTVATKDKEYKVVCGGKGYQVGDIVAYAPVGSKKGGRLVHSMDMKGVTSEGAILSEKELEMSEDNNQIFIFKKDKEPNLEIGVELTEMGRKDVKEDAIPADVSVSQEIERRSKESKDVLTAMEKREKAVHDLWMETRQWSLEEFKRIYEWVGCHFDHFFYESDVGDESKEMVYDAFEKGILSKSENAIGAQLDGRLGFCVLITSAGNGLYATKDLALAKRKFEQFKIDRSIYVVDASQTFHFEQVFATLKKLKFEQAAKCYHLAYGLVVLPDGKMSSRKGNVINFSQLKKELTSKIFEEYMKDKNDWSKEEVEEAVRRIAIATIKYGMLNQDNMKDIVFSMKDWIARTGNTGPYLLYAYARTRAILRKIQIPDEEKQLVNYALLASKPERRILTVLNQFTDVVRNATESYKPQLLCIYLYNLSREFNKFYEKINVKNAEPAHRATLLSFIEASGLIIKKGLDLLGIETIERM